MGISDTQRRAEYRDRTDVQIGFWFYVTAREGCPRNLSGISQSSFEGAKTMGIQFVRSTFARTTVVSRSIWGMILLGSLTCLGLSGCGGNFNNLPQVNSAADGEVKTVSIGNLQGSVSGGQSPIYLGHVFLMKASTGGYGAMSISLLQASANTTQDTTSAFAQAYHAQFATYPYYVTTDGAGYFNITGDYTCNYNTTSPSASDELFLINLSGNATYVPGNPPTGGNTNPYIGEMSVLGQCPSNGTFAGHLNFIVMNEVSTVAAAYALAGFESNSYSVGSSGTTQALVGITNAFANANQLYDIGGSNTLNEARLVTPNGNGTVPYKLVNTLADIIASCINESNATLVPPTTTNCKTLYNDTGNAPETASAMVYIAQHPNTPNLSALYNLASSQPPFADTLTSAPKDFTVGIQYRGSPSLSNPVDVAVDAAGDAWVTSSNGYLSKLSPQGVQATNSPFSVPNANYVAIDSTGNAWATGGSQVYELANSGTAVSGTPYSGGGLFTAGLGGIAVDANGTYVTNPNAGISLITLTTTGDVIQISGPSTNPTYRIYYNGVLGLGNIVVLNGIPNVNQVTNGATGSVWISGDSMTCLLTLSILCGGLDVQQLSDTADFPSGLLFSAPVTETSNWPASGNPFSCFLILACGATEQPEGVAVDNGGRAWVAVDAQTSAATGTTGVDELAVASSSNGAVNGRYTGGGINTPFGVSIDGAGNVFVANSKSGAGSISEFTSSGTAVSGSSGYGSAVVTAPTNLDIDESGDVWVVNPGSSGSVTEFIGIATPTVRPLAAAAASSELGSKP